MLMEEMEAEKDIKDAGGGEMHEGKFLEGCFFCLRQYRM